MEEIQGRSQELYLGLGRLLLGFPYPAHEPGGDQRRQEAEDEQDNHQFNEGESPFTALFPNQ
jgi:hypothetical protein